MLAAFPNDETVDSDSRLSPRTAAAVKAQETDPSSARRQGNRNGSRPATATARVDSADERSVSASAAREEDEDHEDEDDHQEEDDSWGTASASDDTEAGSESSKGSGSLERREGLLRGANFALGRVTGPTPLCRATRTHPHTLTPSRPHRPAPGKGKKRFRGRQPRPGTRH